MKPSLRSFTLFAFAAFAVCTAHALDLVSASFTRPADVAQYDPGDLVANSTTAGSVTPTTLAAASANDTAGRIIGLRLTKSGTGVQGAKFRVHFFRAAPTVANGDNAEFSHAPSGAATYFGSIDVDITRVFSDGAFGICRDASLYFLPASGTKNVFFLIESLSAYTPASGESFSVTAYVQ